MNRIANMIRTAPREITDRLVLVLGASLLAIIGRDRFYLMAQGDGLLSWLASGFLGHRYIQRLAANWHEYSADSSRAGRSTASLHIYADKSLAGFGDQVMAKSDSHLDLEDQHRSILIPEIRAAIENGAETILEIGCGNGEVIAHLSKHYPDVKFIGTDFNIENAITLFPNQPNLNFVAGYPLDLLKDGKIDADLAFAVSTFTVVGPAELKLYADAFIARGFRFILFADPVTRKWHPSKYPDQSRHMTQGLWGHDYAAQFEKVGYKTFRRNVVNYRGSQKRPNATTQIYVGRA